MRGVRRQFYALGCCAAAWLTLYPHPKAADSGSMEAGIPMRSVHPRGHHGVSNTRSRTMSQTTGPVPQTPRKGCRPCPPQPIVGREVARQTGLSWRRHAALAGCVGLLLVGCASGAWATASPSLPAGCTPRLVERTHAKPCAEPARRWAVHRSSLRRLTRWPACPSGAASDACGQPRCAQASGAASTTCAKKPPIASALAGERPRVGFEAGTYASPQPRRPSP